MCWNLAASAAAVVPGGVMAAAPVAARLLFTLQKSKAIWYCSSTEYRAHSSWEISSGLGAVMVSNSEGDSGGSVLLERVGEGCGETSFCVLIVLNCEDCGADGMCFFCCLSFFFRFAW